MKRLDSDMLINALKEALVDVSMQALSASYFSEEKRAYVAAAITINEIIDAVLDATQEVN